MTRYICSSISWRCADGILTLAADIPAVALLELTPRVRGPHAQTLYMIGHSTPSTTPIETAALRDFNPAYDGFGSIASDQTRQQFRPMSALLRKRTTRQTSPLSAGCEQSLQGSPYSITSSASDNRLSDMMMPCALAVFMLMTNSNLSICCTGTSAGLAPLRSFAV
jgi:hypothetical protein